MKPAKQWVLMLCDGTQELVHAQQVPVNALDTWDASPLFYAALCGHLGVVQLLLDAGAVCDASRFEGERAVYAALTHDIRALLMASRLSVAIDPHAAFIRFLTVAFDAAHESLPDIHFRLRTYHQVSLAQFPNASLDPANEEFIIFSAHRCLLAARSPYFAANLAGRWLNRPLVSISHESVTPEILYATLQFICTGTISMHIVPRDHWKQWRFVASQWRLRKLVLEIDDSLTAFATTESSLEILAALPDGKRHRKHRSKYMPKTAAGNLIAKRDTDGLHADMLQMFSMLLRLSHHFTISQAANHKSSATDKAATSTSDGGGIDTDLAMFINACRPDVVVSIDNRLFPCHKLFLKRADYFAVMLSGRYSDFSKDQAHSTQHRQRTGEIVDDLSSLPTITVKSITSASNVIDITISPEIAHDVLIAADLLLLDRLKSLVVLQIVSYSDLPDSPFALMRTAWQLNLPRLEQHLSQYFARHIETLSTDPEFLDLIRESAESIVMRQDTDTVVFVDDLRFWIASICGVNQPGYRSEQQQLFDNKTALLEEALAALDLDI
eukprot:jgi/Hompol1/2410/HPOL_005989-RA